MTNKILKVRINHNHWRDFLEFHWNHLESLLLFSNHRIEFQLNDQLYHAVECEMYAKGCDKDEYIILRMIIRVIIRLSIDGGQPKEDLCQNVPSTIIRRCWSDLLGHRDEIVCSERHFQDSNKKTIRTFIRNSFSPIY